MFRIKADSADKIGIYNLRFEIGLVSYERVAKYTGCADNAMYKVREKWEYNTVEECAYEVKKDTVNCPNSYFLARNFDGAAEGCYCCTSPNYSIVKQKERILDLFKILDGGSAYKDISIEIKKCKATAIKF